MKQQPPRRVIAAEKRALVLDFIARYIEANHYSPCLSEITRGCGFKTKSLAQYYVDQLSAAGRLTVIPFVGRGIRLAPIGVREVNNV